MRKLLVGIGVLATAVSCLALDSSDLLFHLSFDDGIRPEFARGSGEVAKIPDGLDRRLVEGLFGKGYLFLGKGSTLEYFIGGKNGRNCWEMYGAQGNFFGEVGTLSFWCKWFKPLPDTAAHDFYVCNFFICNAGGNGFFQVARDDCRRLLYSYGHKNSCICQVIVPDVWHHLVITWRKNEARSYVDGRLSSAVQDTGVMKQADLPERFQVAYGMVPEFRDDVVMDELQIFRRPLTEVEIQSLFERGHVTAEQRKAEDGFGGSTPMVIKPQREYAASQLTVPLIAAPIQADGDLSDWTDIPAHGCFIERRLGVLDNDPGKVYLACDRKNLYLGFACPVDEGLQKDPTHIMYPNGQFKADAQGRDSDIDSDDYVEFTLKGKDGHVYRFAVNAKNALLDSRDGDKTWNANLTWNSRSDFPAAGGSGSGGKDWNWTAEMVIPLTELGMAIGETIDFNVIRSWKLFKSSQNTFCVNEHALPAMGKLTLGSPKAAALEDLGQPMRGDLKITGSIIGPAGDYTVKARGKGFSEEKKIAVAQGLTRFEISRRLERPDDMAVIMEVLDPAGKPILTRTVPFVYASASSVELTNYPGWGRLDVAVVPQGADAKKMRAVVSLLKDGREVEKAEIAQFDDPCKSVRFLTKELPVGKYEVYTCILRGKDVVGENRQPYEKKPLPEWYHCQAGIIDGPPVPWTDVNVRKRFWGSWFTDHGWKTEIECLLKKITFRSTLFPAEILSNGQKLLAEPIRLRIKRNGQEKVISAGEFKITGKTRRRASWVATARDGDLTIRVNGWIEFDGFTWCDIACEGGKVEHLSLEIPLRRESATLRAGYGVLGEQPIQVSGLGWLGNERAGFQVGWDHDYAWVKNNEQCSITPSAQEVVVSIPFVQKETTLAKPRTVNFYWAITPSKPPRQDIRHLQLDREEGVRYGWVGYTTVTPNYAKSPSNTPEQKQGYKLWYDRLWASLRKKDGPIVCWYSYGAYMWNGAPEYAEWYHEWAPTWPDKVKPDPTSKWMGPTCYNSSAGDLQCWLLEKFVAEYPQRGIYFDMMEPHACKNEAHGCGYVDENGARQTVNNILAIRRHYERIYNIIKAADPKEGWVRFHDWGPGMAFAAFCDDNTVGEQDCGAIVGSPGKNYYTVVDTPLARARYAVDWGHLTWWLTELGKGGKMVRPPRSNGTNDPGEWALSPADLQDHEHTAGLGLIHDMWLIQGNSCDLPWFWIVEMERLMRWDESVKLKGYWELGDLVEMKGGIPEKIVCSAYYRPAGLKRPATDAPEHRAGSQRFWTEPPEVKSALRAIGGSKDGFLILAVMNNTDEDVPVTLKPNPAKAGVLAPVNGQLRDLYRAFDHTWLSQDDYENPKSVYPFTGKAEVFPLKDGAATVMIPKRNFRMLLLEPGQ